MSPMKIDDNQLKMIVKQALIELLEEKNEVFFEALTEVIEDIGLANAIKEGQTSPMVDRARVFKALERKS